MGGDSYIYDQIDQYINISEHIDFAEMIVGKYDWDCETRQKLVSQLQLIHNKQKDKCLNLSVVGEFSAGKSSFINALLGENLLVSSIIQGTTVVNTIIEYYHSPTLYILKKDGTYDVHQPGSVAQLSALLSDVTTNPNTARDIELVRVGIPSDLLSKDIRIIDTPGTNSVESWHEEVTKDALKNLSDLSIILTDGLHALPQTLLDFVEKNLSDIYSQCAFVVTYYDKIKEAERNDVLEYIKTKLTAELDIDNPKVFPFVAPAVMAERLGKCIMDNQQQMVNISEASKEKIVSLMLKNRQISQIKKLLALTKDAFDILEQKMESKKMKYDTEYQLLVKTRQEALEPFVKGEKARCISEFVGNSKDIRDQLVKTIGIWSNVAKEDLKKRLMSSSGTTAESIKNYIINNIPKECEKWTNKIIDQSSAINQTLLTEFTTIMRSFHKNFEERFKELGLINIEFGRINIFTPHTASVSLENFQSSLGGLSEMVKQENWYMGGGGAAGAAIGTAVFPGVGTVIGGLLGMFLGAINSPTIEQIKQSACYSVGSQLDTIFATVETDVISTYNENVLQYENAISNEIDKYLTQYKSAIDKRIEEQNSLIKDNMKLSEWISNDLDMILLRRNQLVSVSETLNRTI